MTQDKEIRMQVGTNGTVASLFGMHDENLKHLEKKLAAALHARGNEVIISGQENDVALAQKVFEHLITLVDAGNKINITAVNYAINLFSSENTEEDVTKKLTEQVFLTPRGKPIKPKTLGQRTYISAIKKDDIVFGIGPAGTGKTYLAVVAAVMALKNKQVNRLVLARPAVEAGEKLGFLPGDLQEKVNPYLRPIYDGLYDVLGFETAQRYVEKGIIEVAPLAYMRGRTLDDSFIILDEAQNTTPQQMKMFLTRIGFGSKAVITGDVTQVDLPQGQYSGLVEVQKILKGIEGIGFIYFSEMDVVRHPLVQKIVHAYDCFENKDKK